MDGTKQWIIGENKYVRIFGPTKKITFQKKTTNGDHYHRSRGVTITQNDFNKMEDVTIVPGNSVKLNGNVYLQHYGSSVKLTRHCFSDNKCCDGGFFLFTEAEWQYFWNVLRLKIKEKLQVSCP